MELGTQPVGHPRFMQSPALLAACKVLAMIGILRFQSCDVRVAGISKPEPIFFLREHSSSSLTCNIT